MKNKFLTKVFAALTAFVMTLTLVPNVTFAAESGKPELKVSVDKSELERTGEFTASVSLNTNNVANISGLQLRLKYDSDVLETVGDVTRILPTRSNELCSPSVDTVNNSANFIYALYDDGASLDYNGVVYTIKFKVKDNANVGKSDLTIDTQTAYPIKNGLDNIEVDSTIINSSINVVNPLNKISLGKETSTLNVGDTETLTVTYDPEDTTEDKTVTWKSSNKDVVSVDNGQVTAKNIGEAVVTAKVGTKTASIKYTVVAPLNGISIMGDNSLLKSEEKQLTVVYDPENTTDDKTVTWESLNKDVLTVVLKSRMNDYIIDETTGKIVKGDKTTDRYSTYKLDFIRTTGEKTKPGSIEINTTNCPNCGAPTQITSSGKCEYCGSVITTGEHSWALSNLEKIG